MACIVFKSSLGERRIPEGVAYNAIPGEVQVGIDWDCGGDLVSHPSEVDKKLESEGLKLGDAIAWMTKKLGIPQCTACAARQEILNSVEKLGWKETFKQIRETL